MQIDYSKFKNMNASNLNSMVTDLSEGKRILEKQAQRFKQCLIDVVNNYYASYDPVIYKRTFGLRESILVDDMISIEKNQISIDVGFFGEGVYGESLFGGEQGYKPHLIGEGWQVIHGWHQDIYRFGFYEGFGNLIDKAIDLWSQSDTEGVIIIQKYSKY